MVLIQFIPVPGSAFAPQSIKVSFERYRAMVKAIGQYEGITWKAYFC